MPALSIQPPFPIFTDTDGQPLENGYVWIGTANQNPITNPIAAYWDAALTVTAAQPVRTLNGYPVNAGTPARLYVNSDYSIQVQNKNGSVVYSAPAATERLSADLVTFIQAGSGAVTRTAQAKMRETVSVEDFGAVGDGVTNDTTAIWNAIISLRANPVSILDTIGGNTITAYSSGIVYFPPGIYKVSPDSLQIYQDLGLTLKGSGSRRTNNSVRASTTLLVSGTSSGFGIQAYRNGGRGLTIQDMDICYETSGFTGSVLDILDCPGVTLNRVFLGTYGLTAGTRLQTAAACLRSTYDEFMHFSDCVFDGAVKGWWSDDTRTELGNTFGGSLTKFDSCVFYDFSENHVYHSGTRTRFGVSFTNCAFNPISVSPSSTCLNMDNVEGISVVGCGFAASVSAAPAVQWLRLTNSTGQIKANFIDDLSQAGQLNGMLEVSGNRLFCTNGFTVTGGVITGSSNEFSKGTSGWIFSPSIDLSFNVGPDLFKNAVTYSYDVPSDSVLLSGNVNYNSAGDASTSKFRNTSSRVRIIGVDQKQFTVSGATYTVSILDTGRTILATGGANQTFTLPTPTPGTVLSFSKLSSVDLTINCAGGTNFYGQNSSALTSAKLTGAAMGGLVLEAYATVGWIVKSQVNSWAYT
jgi:hypothetical protein